MSLRLDDRTLDMATCKASRHHCMVVDAGHRVRQGAYRHRLVWRCSRCGTVRHDLLAWDGRVLQRQYDYPEGYRALEVYELTEVRLALVARAHRRQVEAAASVVPIRRGTA